MTITTTIPKEAELEARINATLARVFLGVNDIKHQLRFKLRLGHTELEAGSRDYVEGRADVMVYRGDVPLAVLELKREGLAITVQDEAQGRSYALLSQAPIVVITNGIDTRIFQTHDMAPLAESSLDAAELAKRIESAATAAQSGVSSAIATLLGNDLARAAIVAVTSSELGELTGGWVDTDRFVHDFLVPRRATRQVRKALEAGSRVIVVTGPPLSGKSSVLREIALDRTDRPTDVLFIEASSCGEGLFRRLANVLASEFSWPATPDEARVWMRQLASRKDRTLILCLDSLPLTGKNLLNEMDELLSSFGDRLKVVVSVEENDAETLLLKPNRREQTRIGRHSTTIKVDGYDDNEFEAAANAIAALGGGIVFGAKYAPELRAPWVLRAAVAGHMDGVRDGLTLVIPPLFGRQMFEVADERFAHLGELRDDFKRLAIAYLNDIYSQKHHGDVLAAMHLVSIRQDVVRTHLERSAIQDLVAAGLLRRGTAFSGESVYVVRVPELFGHEVSARIAFLLPKRAQRDVQEAASWLVKICSKLLFGDVIGARAITLAMRDLGGQLYVDLLNTLLKFPPKRERLAPGSRMVSLLPSVGLVDMKFGVDGTLTLRVRGKSEKELVFPIEVGEEPTAVSDMDGWLILSQLQEFRVALQDEDGHLFNLAAPLLLTLGTCREVLRRPGRELEGFHTHEIDDGVLSCPNNGIAEPITWAIARLLTHKVPGIDREAWVREASQSGSHALINRLGQALKHASNLQNSKLWAEKMLEEYWKPAFKALPEFH